MSSLPEDPRQNPLHTGTSLIRSAHILIINDDEAFTQLLRELLQVWAKTITVIDSRSDIDQALRVNPHDLVIIHYDIIRRYTINLINRIQNILPESQLIAVLSNTSEAEVSELRQQNVTGFIETHASVHVIRAMIERILLARQLELENVRLRAEIMQKNHDLIDLSTTVSQLERSIERAKREVEQRIFTRIRSLMMPLFEDMLQNRQSTVDLAGLEALQQYMNDLASGLATHLESSTPLSAQELRVALMVKNGMTSEDIASHLHVSPETVKTHRRNIRRKFGLTSTSQKLSAYLQALQPVDTNLPAADEPDTN